MVKVIQHIAHILILGSIMAGECPAAQRLKDIVNFQGIRENQLVGYGLVVGLNGTGDDLKNSPYAGETMISMLERLGVNVRDKVNDLKSKNTAAVMVTANLPPFSRHGSRIDVAVSAIGTSKSLLGGILLVTPLMGADGNVYAVAQGPIAIGGYSAEGASNAGAGGNTSGSSVTKGVPTSGRIASGAIVEKEIDFKLESLKNMNISLKNPDLLTAKRIAQAINGFTKTQTAKAIDPSTVSMSTPKHYGNDVLSFLSEIEQLKIKSDQVAKIVIDEQNGVIVIGENVTISTVAIAQGNLTIRITETPQVSQPNPFSNTGQTQVVQRTKIDVDEGQGKKIAVLTEGVSLQHLVDSLNALGVGPRDLITILRAIKTAGALQAEIEVM